MTNLKIVKKCKDVSKTLRLPADVVSDLETLAQIKHTSLNQISIILFRFSLDNLDQEEKVKMEKFRKEKLNDEEFNKTNASR